MAIDFEALLTRDVFIDYNFEEVMYRWDHREKKYTSSSMAHKSVLSRLLLTIVCIGKRCARAGKSLVSNMKKDSHVNEYSRHRHCAGLSCSCWAAG